MAEPPDEREKKPGDEDLFEDLDEFFAPLEDAGWPEGEGEAGEGEAGEDQARARPAETEDLSAGAEALEDWDVAIEVPGAEELLAEGAEGAEPADAAAEAGPEAEPGSPDEPEVIEGTPGEAEGEEVWSSTAEPEGEESLSAEDLEEGPPAAEAEFAKEAGSEGEGPLSLDDLRSVPPAYADLPAPPEDEAEEEPVLPEEVGVSAEDLFEEEPEEEGAAIVDEAVEREAAGEGAAAGEGQEEGPEPEAIEAAAEHFASGIRETPEEVERELLADLEGEETAPEVETVTIAPPPPVPAEGPSWQEGAEQVAEEAAAVPGGRNLTAAFASGILLAIAVLALLVIGKGAFAWFAGAVVLLGQAELYAVMRARRLQPATLLGLVCGALLIAGAYLHGPVAVPFGLFLAMGLTVLWYMAAPAPSRRSTTINAGATILGTVYVPFLASFAILLLAFPGNLGRNAFLVVVGLTVLYDVCAYAIGTLWGSRPLAPTISPQKSWEGAIGATFVLLLVALAIVPSIDPFDAPGRAVGLALVIAFAAPLGDLVESALKRDLGVKDMGTILPGHGGILDRIDAILFSAPAAYYFLQLSF